MGARHTAHPQAIRDRLFAESQRRSPWTPTRRYRIVLKRRDEGTEFRSAPPTIEEARSEVRRFFDFDVLDVYSHAWIREEAVL